MFTGIIQAIGSVQKLQQKESQWRISIDSGELDLSDVKLGDSIAVNGCCLTVITLSDRGFSADVSNETMRCTTLGSFKTGARVNLEKAMLATSRFGGHIVSGHVDGVGSLLESTNDAQSVRLLFEVPENLARYIAAKGSICIDGTSLTVNTVDGSTFTVNIIPHTQKETVSGDYRSGQSVNLEVDIIARYLERMMHTDAASPAEAGEISREFLAENGFQ